MGLILNIATILGGLAAIWFFAERFLTFRGVTPAQISHKEKSVSNQPGRQSFPVLEMIVTGILCGIGGLVVGLIFMRFGSSAIPLTLTLGFGFVLCFVSASLEIGPLELSAAFMTSWTAFGIIVFVPFESISGVNFAESPMGTILIVIGVVLGFIYGAWEVNDPVYRFVHYRE